MRKCDTKVMYDTEFEANRAAAKSEYRWKEEMESYQCGTHWHIAHVNPELWGKHPKPERKDYCEYCHQGMKLDTWQKHIKKNGHVRAEREAKRKEAL